jgi:hypothetical protein
MKKFIFKHYAEVNVIRPEYLALGGVIHTHTHTVVKSVLFSGGRGRRGKRTSKHFVNLTGVSKNLKQKFESN